MAQLNVNSSSTIDESVILF